MYVFDLGTDISARGLLGMGRAPRGGTGEKVITLGGRRGLVYCGRLGLVAFWGSLWQGGAWSGARLGALGAWWRD